MEVPFKVEDLISWRHFFSTGGSVSILCEGHISSLATTRDHETLQDSHSALMCVCLLTGYLLDFLFPDNDFMMREVRKT